MSRIFSCQGILRVDGKRSVTRGNVSMLCNVIATGAKQSPVISVKKGIQEGRMAMHAPVQDCFVASLSLSAARLCG